MNETSVFNYFQNQQSTYNIDSNDCENVLYDIQRFVFFLQHLYKKKYKTNTPESNHLSYNPTVNKDKHKNTAFDKYANTELQHVAKTLLDKFESMNVWEIYSHIHLNHDNVKSDILKLMQLLEMKHDANNKETNEQRHVGCNTEQSYFLKKCKGFMSSKEESKFTFFKNEVSMVKNAVKKDESSYGEESKLGSNRLQKNIVENKSPQLCKITKSSNNTQETSKKDLEHRKTTKHQSMFFYPHQHLVTNTNAFGLGKSEPTSPSTPKNEIADKQKDFRKENTNKALKKNKYQELDANFSALNELGISPSKVIEYSERIDKLTQLREGNRYSSIPEIYKLRNVQDKTTKDMCVQTDICSQEILNYKNCDKHMKKQKDKNNCDSRRTVLHHDFQTQTDISYDHRYDLPKVSIVSNKVNQNHLDIVQQKSAVTRNRETEPITLTVQDVSNMLLTLCMTLNNAPASVRNQRIMDLDPPESMKEAVYVLTFVTNYIKEKKIGKDYLRTESVTSIVYEKSYEILDKLLNFFETSLNETNYSLL